MQKKSRKSFIWNLFLNSHRIVLTTHVRPDGDGLASELALFSILTSFGKDVTIVNQDRTPEMYRWLPHADEIITLEQGDVPKPDGAINLSVLLDCSSRDRIGQVYEYIKDSKMIISLDHHEDSECFWDHCHTDTSASSIGELLYYLIPDIQAHLDKDISLCIYESIMTDTGSFAFSNTTTKVFQIASRLLSYGVDADYAHRMTYNNKRLNHFRLLGKVLERLNTDETGKIVYVVLPMSVFKEAGAVEEDNEGILEVIRGMRNIELIILLRQLDERRVKGSLRSLNAVNCNYLAKLYGGGGHFKASGFVIEGDVTRIGGSIIKKITDRVREQGWI